MSMRTLLSLLLAMLLTSHVRADGQASSADARAQIIESSLTSLSNANDAAIGDQALKAHRSTDALGAPRVVLEPPTESSADTRVQRSVTSSLHRLRRETVIVRTPDPRRTAVEESLLRQADVSEMEASSSEDIDAGAPRNP